MGVAEVTARAAVARVAAKPARAAGAGARAEAERARAAATVRVEAERARAAARTEVAAVVAACLQAPVADTAVVEGLSR